MKTKQIRSMLCKALARVEAGELPLDEAKSIVGLANQINASLATEVKVAHLKMRAGAQVDTFGELDVTK